MYGRRVNSFVLVCITPTLLYTSYLWLSLYRFIINSKNSKLVIPHKQLPWSLAHDRFGSSSDPTLNGRLHYNDIDKSLNEDSNDKIRKYRSDYNNYPPNTVTFIPTIPGTNGRLHSDFRRVAVLNQLKSKCGLLLAKDDALRVTLNLDGTPIVFNSHTHPSHSQTSRLLTSSLSLGVPDPRPTQCMRDE